jgi:tripartite-type tricarboxylate transporter receptor subunit TctC
MIKDAAPDGYTLGVWHMGLLTAAAMGVTDYDHTAYELVAQIGTIPVGLAVRSDSKVHGVRDLVAAARARPGEVTAAMNVGLLPHFVPLMLAHEAGVQFRWVQAGGGAVRLQSVLGGHTEFSLFSVPELLNFTPQGIRPIVLFSDKRDPRLPELGTTLEAGYKTIFTEVIMWLAPRGTPAARLEVVRKALRGALSEPELVERFKQQGIDRSFLSGAELRPILDEKLVSIRAVAGQIKQEKK